MQINTESEEHTIISLVLSPPHKFERQPCWNCWRQEFNKYQNGLFCNDISSSMDTR